MTYNLRNDNIFNVQCIKTSSPSAQTSSSSWQDLEGSDITYNCTGSPTKVIYEYNFCYKYSSVFFIGDFKLVEYNTGTSSWDEVSNSAFLNDGTANNGSYPAGYKSFSFCLDNWSGNKQLKLQWKNNTGSAQAHRMFIYQTNGTYSASYVRDCHLIMYSIA